MEDRTHNGVEFRILNVMDEFTRECLAVRIGRSLTHRSVIEVLKELFMESGVPVHIRSDNGSEFTAKRVRAWQLPTIELESWETESTFRSEMDVVEYKTRARNGNIVTRKRGVIPDGFFAISDKLRREQGKPYRARFLLELDMATHDNPSFGSDKVAPGVAYIKSTLYKSRFGANAGLWLVITTGETRMMNLIGQTMEIAGSDSGLFFFTTIENLGSENLFTSSIWHQAGRNAPSSLLEP